MFEKGDLIHGGKAYFFDWPTLGKPDSVFACYAVTLYTVRAIIDCAYFGDEVISIAKDIEERLSVHKKEISAVKAISALGLLVDKSDRDSALNYILEGGAKGYSAFMTYFITKALAENGHMQDAFNACLEYYGGMLKMGATSFWEGFNVEWMENACGITERPKEWQKDIHGDFGECCYIGYRHSLCHGWSCGVLGYFIEYLVGFKLSDSDYTKFSLKPNLCGLKYVKCKIPTAKGILEIELTQKENEIERKLNIPEGMTLVD